MTKVLPTIVSLLKIGLVIAFLGTLFVTSGYIGVQWALSAEEFDVPDVKGCLLYTSPSPRDGLLSRMPSSA